MDFDEASAQHAAQYLPVLLEGGAIRARRYFASANGDSLELELVIYPSREHCTMLSGIAAN